MNSIWLEHPKHPDYRVSPEGNVLSLKNKEPKILKPRFKKNGYAQVVLNGKHLAIHRLVAELFLDMPDHLHEVNHKNGLKTDNRVENLEWVTKRQNMIHSYNKLGRPRKNGEKSNFSKLTEDEVKEIMVYLNKNKYRGRFVFLAKKYGVSHGTISMIGSGKVWAHLKV